MIAPAIITTTVPAERGSAILPCSTTLGCAITLPANERIENITLGDEQYAVKIQSDGATWPVRILVYPMRTGAVETRLDILSSRRPYVLVIEPFSSNITRVLAFTESARQKINPSTLSPLFESNTLDPTKISYSWHYRGDSEVACQGVFEYRSSAIWCMLPNSLDKAPSVYGIVGNGRRPVDARVVNRTYLVIDSTDGPFEINVVTDGVQRRGILERVK